MRGQAVELRDFSRRFHLVPTGHVGTATAYRPWWEKSERVAPGLALALDRTLRNGGPETGALVRLAESLDPWRICRASLAARRSDVAGAILRGVAEGRVLVFVTGGPSAPQGTQTPKHGEPVAKPRIGKLSEKYEVSNGGPGVVSTGAGDAGGASYGLYQMTSQHKGVVGGTVAAFIGQADFPHKKSFEGLTPGSAEFTKAWKDLAAADPDGFSALQHTYIERTHYKPVADALRTATGLELAARSAALRDVVWSTAVQHGPGTGIVSNSAKALIATGSPKPAEGKLFDLALIEAIYAERGRKRADGKLAYFSRNSDAVQKGVAARFVSELKDAKQMLKAEF